MDRIQDIIMDFASDYRSFNAEEALKYCITREVSTLQYVRKVLMHLVNNGKLVRVNNGVYQKTDKAIFRPHLSPEAQNIHKSLIDGKPALA